MSPQRPRLARFPSLPATSTPGTPPPMYSVPPYSSYSTYSAGSSSQHPFYPACPGTPSREIIMGGLVSRPLTPRTPQTGDGEYEYDEKLDASIEVPGIILTEPLPDLPPRTPSPPPKSILLLPPVSLPLPDSPKSPVSIHRPFSPHFTSIIHGRKQSSATSTTIRTVILLGAVALGAWHLYTTLDMSTLVEDVMTEAI